MTSRQIATSLRMQAHSLINFAKKFKSGDMNQKDLVDFTVYLLIELSRHKVAQASMLEQLSPMLKDVQFETLNQEEDLTPFSKPPVDL